MLRLKNLSKKYTTIVKLLLDNNTNPHSTGFENTPLVAAVFNSDIDSIIMLLDCLFVGVIEQ